MAREDIWDEAKHPRGRDGRFVHSGSTGFDWVGSWETGKSLGRGIVARRKFVTYDNETAIIRIRHGVFAGPRGHVEGYIGESNVASSTKYGTSSYGDIPPGYTKVYRTLGAAQKNAEAWVAKNWGQ